MSCEASEMAMAGVAVITRNVPCLSMFKKSVSSDQKFETVNGLFLELGHDVAAVSAHMVQLWCT
jgi:hypothetical protein